MTTTSTARRATVTALLAGTAVLAAAPAYAKPGPVDYGSLQTKAQAAGTAAETKAQVEHNERVATGGGTRSTGLAPRLSPQIQRMERAMHDQPPAPQARQGTTTDSSDPAGIPVTVLALLAGGFAAAAAGAAVYRFRHNGSSGPVRTAAA